MRRESKSPKNVSVLISGASIGGPTLAYWLNQYGFRVTVVERWVGLRPGGQAIDVRGPALEVAERMGVLDEMRRRSTDLRGMSVVDDDGEELFRSTEHTVSGGQIASPDVEILRDDLARILYDAGGSDIEYLFGDSIATIEQDDDEVRVVFDSGTSRTFDLVVGADGVHSHTRGLVFGPEEDYLRHLGAYLGVWTVPNHLGLDRWEVIYQMPGRDVWGAMVMSVRGNSEARAFIGIESDRPPARFLPRDTVEQKHLVAGAYEGAGWEVPRLLKEMWDAPDFHLDALAQIHLDSWSHGRITLLGDAGYCASPASGQGTTMAMTAAYILAGELDAALGDHRTAFAAYERELRDFVALNQEFALINRAAMRAKQEAAADQVAPLAPHEDDASAAVFAKLNAFRLKDYQAASVPGD
ncbi:FAD-dependent monooxygenase [Streptomyces kanamyceticus]|nr:FAD-dependent monooxygenase [Streptomyces kanamyceticus]QEU89919.1 FAD-dependent oxidoreductase [Streptomyces kanamyceticus]